LHFAYDQKFWIVPGNHRNLKIKNKLLNISWRVNTPSLKKFQITLTLPGAQRARERGGSDWCGRLGQQSRRGSKLSGDMNILNEKFYFLRTTIFKSLSRIKGYSIDNCDF
jgi:hypothetical protein